MYESLATASHAWRLINNSFPDLDSPVKDADNMSAAPLKVGTTLIVLSRNPDFAQNAKRAAESKGGDADREDGKNVSFRC